MYLGSEGQQAQLASRRQMLAPVVEVVGNQPIVPEAPHLLDDREEGNGLLRQLVLDPWGPCSTATAGRLDLLSGRHRQRLIC